MKTKKPTPQVVELMTPSKFDIRGPRINQLSCGDVLKFDEGRLEYILAEPGKIIHLDPNRDGPTEGFHTIFQSAPDTLTVTAYTPAGSEGSKLCSALRVIGVNYLRPADENYSKNLALLKEAQTKQAGTTK